MSKGNTSMKKTGRIFAALMALMMILALIPAYAFAETPYQITFDPANGGETEQINTGEDGTLGTNMPASPSKENYTFDGWYLSGEKVSGSFVFTENTTVKAKWVADVASVSLPTDLPNEIKVGDPIITLKATVTMKDTNAAPAAVTWEISDAAGALTTTQTGDQCTVTAKKEGTATITAKAGGQHVSWSVTVKASDDPTPEPVAIVSISMTPEKKTLYDSQTVQMEVKKVPENATLASLVFTSSKPDVATVDPDTGLVEAAGYGKATITATATDEGGKVVTAQSTIKVMPKIHLSFDPNTSKLTKTNNKVKITVTVTNPADGYVYLKRGSKRIYFMTDYDVDFDKTVTKSGVTYYRYKLDEDNQAVVTIHAQYNGQVVVTTSATEAASVSSTFYVSDYTNLPATGQDDRPIYALAGAGILVAGGLAAAYVIKRKKKDEA